MPSETEDERAKRLGQRVLFDALYERTRAGYPKQVIDHLFDTAGLEKGSRVLEVGCGTGQLTVDLARRDVELTAIDIGAAMAAATSEKVKEYGVEVEHCPFETFDAPEGWLDALVSATAFHWIDPDTAWTKAAALLRPGGWIAILATAERYDDPLGTAFRQQWIRYSPDGGAWATAPRPTLAETIAATNLFHTPLTAEHLEPRSMAPDTMIDLERTRATTLSYDAETRERFFADLRSLLHGLDEVALTQETTLTMAQRK